KADIEPFICPDWVTGGETAEAWLAFGGPASRLFEECCDARAAHPEVAPRSGRMNNRPRPQLESSFDSKWARPSSGSVHTTGSSNHPSNEDPNPNGDPKRRHIVGGAAPNLGPNLGPNPHSNGVGPNLGPNLGHHRHR